MFSKQVHFIIGEPIISICLEKILHVFTTTKMCLSTHQLNVLKVHQLSLGYHADSPIPNCTSGKDVYILVTDTLSRGSGQLGQ